MSDHQSRDAFTSVSILASAMFALIFLLIGWDLLEDYHEGAAWSHLTIEVTVLMAAAVGIGVLWWRYALARTEVRGLARDLAQAQDEARHWKDESRDLISGLGRAIEHQFARWDLTTAEAEIALLMLKGLSHKEIADARHTSERTVREQARSVYRKAGLQGRSALSAFFLEDLLLPRD